MTLRANLSLHVVQGYGSRDGDKKLPSHFNQRGLLIAAVLIFGLPERQSRSSPLANEGGSSTPFPGWREEMIRTIKQLLSAVLSFLLVFTSVPFEAAAQQPAPAESAGYSGQGAPLSADQLE